jgi:hypothetical protein
MLSITNNSIILGIIMLGIIMLGIIMLGIIILSVLASYRGAAYYMVESVVGKASYSFKLNRVHYDLIQM